MPRWRPLSLVLGRRVVANDWIAHEYPALGRETGFPQRGLGARDQPFELLALLLEQPGNDRAGRFRRRQAGGDRLQGSEDDDAAARGPAHAGDELQRAIGVLRIVQRDQDLHGLLLPFDTSRIVHPVRPQLRDPWRACYGPLVVFGCGSRAAHSPPHSHDQSNR